MFELFMYVFFVPYSIAWLVYAWMFRSLIIDMLEEDDEL